MTRPRRWTDDDLRAAVRSSTTYSQVLAALGLSRGGRSSEAVRNRMLQMGLDLEEPERGKRPLKWKQDRSLLLVSPTGRQRTWTDEQLAQAVAESFSVAGVIRALGLRIGGSMCHHQGAHRGHGVGHEPLHRAGVGGGKTPSDQGQSQVFGRGAGVQLDLRQLTSAQTAARPQGTA